MNNGNRPLRILAFGDLRPTGFGRILRNVTVPLHHKPQYDVMGACIHHDGILPLNATVPPHDAVPFHVCGLAGRDNGQMYVGFAQVLANIWQAWRPDIIISAQDFPYHTTLRAMPIDWSTTAHIVITPVDGTPVARDWLDAVGQFDAFMTISQFGVDAFKAEGVRADLCPPGVDTDVFKPLSEAERGALRDQMGIDRGAFVVGVMAMNQGRKNFPAMLRAFADAYRDVPDAVLYFDAEAVGHWNVPEMAKHIGLAPERIKFRNDAFAAGIADFNQRYNLLDLHMVVSEREGFGLPHIEAQATGIPTVSLDYCSGREICGENGERGYLVPAYETEYGTWGGAMNMFPKRREFAAVLREAYDNPAERKAKGARALEWVRTERTWTRAADAFERVLQRVIEKRGDDLREKDIPPMQTMPPLQATQAAGINPVLVFNGPVHVNGHNAQQLGAALLQAAQPAPVLELASVPQGSADNG